jgi:S-adenosylmethionine/arginine decarboxylase-like enzyme
MINAGRCCPKAVRSSAAITTFSNDLVKRIDMIPYGSPQVQHFGEGNKAGYTLVQLIQTSNITAHFVEETNDIYLDVFSCKKFDPKVVEKCLSEHFKPVAFKSLTLNRQAPN